MSGSTRMTVMNKKPLLYINMALNQFINIITFVRWYHPVEVPSKSEMGVTRYGHFLVEISHK